MISMVFPGYTSMRPDLINWFRKPFSTFGTVQVKQRLILDNCAECQFNNHVLALFCQRGR